MIKRLHKSGGAGSTGTGTDTDTDTDTEPAYPVELPRHLGKVLSRMSIQSKFLLMLLAISILSAGVVGYIGFQSGRTSLRAAAFDRLAEVRESQNRQLEAELAEL